MSSEIPDLETFPERWVTADVTFERTNGVTETRVEMIHFPKDSSIGTRYLHEPLAVTAFKCFLIFLALPAFLALNMAFHVIRTVAMTIKTLITDGCPESLNALVEGIQAFLFAPYYAVRMAGWALYGLYSPLEAKIHVPQVEQEWSRGATIRDSLNFSSGGAPRDIEIVGLRFWDLLTNRDSRSTFFLAACFQPYGRTDDPHVGVWREISSPVSQASSWGEAASPST